MLRHRWLSRQAELAALEAYCQRVPLMGSDKAERFAERIIFAVIALVLILPAFSVMWPR